MRNPTNSKTTFFQKCLLLTFSVVLSLVLLEGVLRAGGFIFTALQEKRNRVAFAQKEFRILCIGESTTALGGENSYPSQLEDILNKRQNAIHFEVINKGLVSKTSRDILVRLPQFLQKYQPHLVVGMIGINDAGIPDLPKDEKSGLFDWGRDLRVYKFFMLLAKHIQAKRGQGETEDKLGLTRPEVVPPAEMGLDRKYMETSTENVQQVKRLREGIAALETERARLADPDRAARLAEEVRRMKMQGSLLLMHLGWSSRVHGELEDARRYLHESILWGPAHYGVFVELGRCYSEEDRCAEAVPILLKAIEFSPDSVLGLMNLARCYSKLGAKEKARDVFLKVFALNPVFFRVDREIGLWLLENGYLAEAQAVLLEAAKENNRDYFLYQKLAELYARTGQPELAEKYRQEAQALEAEVATYLPVTRVHYKRIVERVHLNGLPFLCMQYPLRSIAPLKETFAGQEGIFFLENKDNFNEALQDEEFSEYFSDTFAGDFGHCTPKGNRLIAENVADFILTEIVPTLGR